MHILIGLFLGSFFNRTVLLVFLGILSTLLLPPKPVLWTAFCQSPVFRTWREYFNFRCVWAHAWGRMLAWRRM